MGWEGVGKGGGIGSVGRSGARRAGSVGSVDGVMGWLHCCLGGQNARNSACFEAFWPQNLPAAPCFCFFVRGPGPSEGAGRRPLTERLKTLRLEQLFL